MGFTFENCDWLRKPHFGMGLNLTYNANKFIKLLPFKI